MPEKKFTRKTPTLNKAMIDATVSSAIILALITFKQRPDIRITQYVIQLTAWFLEIQSLLTKNTQKGGLDHKICSIESFFAFDLLLKIIGHNIFKFKNLSSWTQNCVQIAIVAFYYKKSNLVLIKLTEISRQNIETVIFSYFWRQNDHFKLHLSQS